MASEASGPAVNGTYGGQPPYQTGDAASRAAHHAAATNGPTSAANDHHALSKDEVGWAFVEQYYTTLSRHPEKLYLFYAKRSQFVSGVEAEKVSVSVGQRAIGERIRDLDIQDCKVRVTNVDAQESGRDIVVQVIGEMSNKAAPHRKFVQTFVLAEQPNGYFVLNDIFRYIAEEEAEPEEDVAAPTAGIGNFAAGNAEPHTLTPSADRQQQEKAAAVVDARLEQAAAATPSLPEASLKVPTQSGVSADTSSTTAAVAEKQATQEEPQPEQPPAPQATPAAPSPQPTPSAPVEPIAAPKPAAPKTWASMVAANKVAPAVPSAASTSPAPSQPRAAAPASTSAGPTASPGPAPPNAPADDAQALPSPGGWQTAGPDHARKQIRQPPPSGERGNTSGYIKNVSDRIDASALRLTLSKFGKIDYLDISRAKNCAFIEFADPAAYNAAVAASPHTVNGEELTVEERRRMNPYGGYNNRGAGGMRGNRASIDAGRGGAPGGRGGSYRGDSGRGGYMPRGRGGMNPRGRGMPQAA